MFASLGALIATGQAPLDLWFLAFPVLAVALVFVGRAVRPVQAAFWVGFGYSLLAMVWIAEPFLVEPAQTGWMMPFAVAAMATGLGLFWAGGAFVGLWMSGRVAPFGRAFGIALGIAAAEFARSYLFTGFPWALLGHMWIDSAPYQLARIVGPLGMTLATLVAAAGLGVLWQRARIWGAAATVVAEAVAALWPSPVRDVPDLNGQPVVRLVQPNAPQHQKWDPAFRQQFYQRQLAFTAAPGDVDLTIWPEVAVTFRLEYPDAPFDEIAAAARGGPVIFGAQRVEGMQAYNALAQLSGAGAMDDIYDKHHLVPFGEYIPGGDLVRRLGLRGLAEQLPLGFSPGAGPRVMAIENVGTYVPMICYEAIFPHELRKVDARPDFLLHLTNDAWFGPLSGPYQHLAQARARAIEFGLPVIRVANTGVSAVIDARGGIRDQLALNEAGFVDASLPRPTAATMYWRFGDRIAFALLFAGLIGLGLLGRSKSH